MGKRILTCCTLALFLTIAPVLCKKQSENTKPKKHEKRPSNKEERAIILSHFAGIVSSFLTLVQDPHNTTHVGHHLGDMIHGIANIISTAIKKGEKLEEHVQSPEFRKEVAELITKRMRLIEDEKIH